MHLSPSLHEISVQGTMDEISVPRHCSLSRASDVEWADYMNAGTLIDYRFKGVQKRPDEEPVRLLLDCKKSAVCWRW